MKSRFLKFSSAVETYFPGNSELLEELVMLDQVLIYARIASIRVIVTDALRVQKPEAREDSEYRFLSGFFPISAAFAKILMTNGSATAPFFWVRDDGQSLPSFSESLPPNASDKKAWITSRNGLDYWPISLESAYVSRKGVELAIARSFPEREVVSVTGNWPWGMYETEELRHLAATAEKWWKNYDPCEPDTAPTKDEVTKWLKGRGVEGRAADRIDTILRAKDLPKGPRRPK